MVYYFNPLLKLFVIIKTRPSTDRMLQVELAVIVTLADRAGTMVVRSDLTGICSDPADILGFARAVHVIYYSLF